MYNEEEEKLTEYKKMYDKIPISLESIDNAILAGFQRAKAEKPRHKKWMFSLAAAAVLLIGFFTSIRLSPVFAGYITIIPGMEKVVELIRYDKGMLSAIENDYYQKLDISQEKNDMKLTIDGVISDENGLVIFYTVSSKENLDERRVREVELKPLDGEKLNEFTSGLSQSANEGKKSFSGTIDYFFKPDLKARKFELSLEVEGRNVKEKFVIPFQLEKDLKVKKTYHLNQTIIMEGQKMTFVSATVTPLRAAVHVKMDPTNSKKFLGFEDLRLVDENGEVWNKIANGITSSTISDNEEIIYLQSNYFRQPKELYLRLNKIQAIEKDEAYVVVDINNGKILTQPKENLLTDPKITQTELIFSFHSPIKSFSLGRILDVDGNEFYSGSTYSHHTENEGDSGISETGLYLPELQKLKGPLSLEIGAFPSWIEGNVKIKIN